VERGVALDLFSKRLLVVSGKGGVGKTVVSSALGLLAARRGKSVLLVKMDDQGRTAQLFGTPPLTDRVAPLRGSISAVNLDPKTVAADYIYRQLRIRRLVRHIVDSQLFESWFRVSPAIKEMILLGKVSSLVEERSWLRGRTWDLVIFDAPATGHGLGLLRLPEQAAKLLIGGLRKSALAVGDLLSDPTRTNVLLVTIPEEMPVNEAIHFYESAREGLAVKLAAVVLNAAFPARFPPEQIGEVEAAAGSPAARAALDGLAPAAEGAAPLRRAAERSAQRSELTARYAGVLRERVDLPLLELPYVYAERFGYAELEQVAGHLAAALEARAGSPAP